MNELYGLLMIITVIIAVIGIDWALRTITINGNPKYLNAKKAKKITNKYITKGELVDILTEIKTLSQSGKNKYVTNDKLYDATINSLLKKRFKVNYKDNIYTITW